MGGGSPPSAAAPFLVGWETFIAVLSTHRPGMGPLVEWTPSSNLKSIHSFVRFPDTQPEHPKLQVPGLWFRDQLLQPTEHSVTNNAKDKHRG